ncbi:MAG: hypothetical protein IJW12_07300 [Opitutales bacterium]|nr:hypothetical protein [Opitutales bacterium]
MATGTAAATAAQMGGSVLSSEMSSSPSSSATSGDAKGGTTGNFSFGNVNFSGSQTNSGSANWLVIGGAAVAIALIYFLAKK